jgi:ribosomal protein S12 methylthiotransferase
VTRQADVLIVNTCAFIDSAKQESIDTILENGGAQEGRRVPAPDRDRLPG